MADIIPLNGLEEEGDGYVSRTYSFNNAQTRQLAASLFSQIGLGGNYKSVSTKTNSTVPDNRNRYETEYATPIMGVPKDWYDAVQLARMYRHQESVVRSMIDRLVHIAYPRFFFQCQNKEREPLLKYWARTVNRIAERTGGLHSYNLSVLEELLVAGRAVTIESWGPFEFEGKTYQMPLALEVLNSQALVPDIIDGKRRYWYKLTEQQRKAVLGTDGVKPDSTITKLVPDAKEQLTRTTNEGFTDYMGKMWPGDPYILLPSEIITAIDFNDSSYYQFPPLFLESLFAPIAFKRTMLLADATLAKGIINLLVIVTFDTKNNTEYRDKKERDKVVNALQRGGRAQSIGLPSGVTIEYKYPDTTVLMNDQKYNIPHRDTMAQFGFNLHPQASSNTAAKLDTQQLDVKSFKAFVMDLQQRLISNGSFILDKVARRNKWAGEITDIAIPRPDLEPSEFATFVQGLYQIGALDFWTLLESAGYDSELVLARRQEEEDRGITKLLMPRPQFSQTVVNPTDNTTSTTTSPNGGRPAGTKNGA